MADEGYGQQNPADQASKFNGLNFIVDQVVSKLSTVKLVQVKSVDTAAKTVSVQPMVNMTDGNNKTSEHGEVFGIPYWGWQFGKNAFLADPAVGDIGVMVCADRDISAVKSTKKIGPPGSDRQMSMSDGIYFGGILNETPEQWIKFTDTGMEWHDKNGNILVSKSTGWEFTGKVKFNGEVTIDDDLIVTQVAKITGNLQLGGSMVNIAGATYSGNIVTSGEVTAGSIGLKTHHHTAQGALAATTAAQT
jgi:hypothetical protein